MSTPLWVHELAAEFWEQAGGNAPFPRDLRAAVTRAFPLTVVERPNLSVTGVATWLRRQGVTIDISVRDRLLQACLVARADCGFVFLDAGDDPAEQRFSLAHELAHYLRDFWRPRSAAARTLGPRVLQVFDGSRSPTPEEKLHAVLRGVRLDFQAHLLARDGATPRGAVADAEVAADRLAYELLAPADIVRTCGSHAEAERRLRADFGLPPVQAARYAAILYPVPDDSALAVRLRIAEKPVSNFGGGRGIDR